MVTLYVVLNNLLGLKQLVRSQKLSQFKAYPETRSLGMSCAKASAMSLEPTLAMHCRARLTCTGFLDTRSFLMLLLIRLIRSLFWLTSTEMKRYPWKEKKRIR